MQSSSPWSPGAQPAVPMATVSSGWGQGGGQSPECLPRHEKWGQMGAADCDGRWGHQAGNLRAWPPLSLKQTARVPTGAGPGADPRLSSCPPPPPHQASAVSVMAVSPGPGGQGSWLRGPSAARGWGYLQGDHGLDCQRAELDCGQAPGWWLWWAVRTTLLRTGLCADGCRSPWRPGRGCPPGPVCC